MKAKLNYTVRTTRAPGEARDAIVPVIVERLSPVELETVVESCIDRGLIAGLKPTAAHGIAEGVAAQIAREFSLGRGVQFGQYFYGRPYLSGTVDANGRVTKANAVNVRLYKGDAFKLTLGDFSMNFEGSGDAVKIDYVYGDTSAAGGATRGQVVPGNPVVVQGGNFWAAGDVNKVTFAEAGGSATVEVTQFDAQGPDILAFAWPGGLVAGKRYGVTVSRTDPNGVTRTSAPKTVTVHGDTPPPGPVPKITDARSDGMEADHVVADGESVTYVSGENLNPGDEGAEVVLEDGDDNRVGHGTGWWSEASNSLEVTLEHDADPATGMGTIKVILATGTAEHEVFFA